MKFVYSITIVWFMSVWGSQAQTFPLIPFPAEMKTGVGSFAFVPSVRVVLKSDSPEVKQACDFFLGLINPGTGLNIGYSASSAYPIVVELDSMVLHPEGYRLKVTTSSISIQAQSAAGVFYAFQTLRQLLPPMVESRSMLATRRWTVPVVEINDAPRFSYRGLLLDVVRHFFPVNDVKRFIDLMAMYKYNYLHLHLTDDQGWRIEIPAFSRLQSVAAWRKETLVGHLNDEPPRYDGIRYGGYYTQAELRELVQYAAERYITIVPEIEIPGHATALLAAYPALGCLTSISEPAREWGVFANLLCPREDTFLFLEKILDEVMHIFPGKYIHLGGDECPKEQWQLSEFCKNTKIQNGLNSDEQLQTWFMRRLARYVQSHGRQPVGWDEMVEGGEISGATIMSWRGEQGGVAAAEKGYEVIMTPPRNCYFDYYQWSKRSDEPLAQGGYLPLSMVYQFEPVPKELPDELTSYIVGTQGNLWTEYVTNMRQAEYMLYPRACALAETAWTPANRKSYNQFLIRLREHSKRLELLNVNHARHVLPK